MLRKLLKYDFKAMFKYWWIAALISILLSLIGGGCISLLQSDKVLPDAINIIAILILVLIIFGYAAFSFVTVILVFTRFYKNFYTDEGYLTFTLPVKRAQLLNSKLIMSTFAMFATGLMCVINVCLMLCIGFFDEIFSKAFWDELAYIFSYLSDVLGAYLLVYMIEILLLIILYIVFSNLFLFCCITFASIITRKAKVITAIGIYYGVSSVCTFIVQIFLSFGVDSLSYWLSGISVAAEQGIFALILLCILLFVALLCSLLYTLQYWMMDRKLNLS